MGTNTKLEYLMSWDNGPAIAYYSPFQAQQLCM